MSVAGAPSSRMVLTTRVHEVTPESAVATIVGWAQQRRSAYVTLTNVHMVMEAYDDPAFAAVVNGADLSCPDGRPVYWVLKSLGATGAAQVRGPALLPAVCAAAEQLGIPVGFYGSSPETLGALVIRLRDKFPRLDVRCELSPPFRQLSAEEDRSDTQKIIDSRAAILFIGLGCPKQERWMAAHTGRVPAVMLGVGAAFDINAGRVHPAPALLSSLGLEWAYRFALEPWRLGRRYAKHNPRFMVLAFQQALSKRRPTEPRT